MARDFTTNNFLIPQVRVLGDFPDDDPRTTDDLILDIANRRLLVEMVPFMQKVRGDYWIKRESQTIVKDQIRYRIPTRAVGGGVDSIFWQQANPASSNQDIYHLDHYSLTDGISSYTGRYRGAAGDAYGYHIEGDEILLSPEPPSNAGTLIVLYNRSPNELVKTGTSDVLVISAVGSTTSVTVETNSAFADGAYTCDVIQSRSNFDSLGDDVSITKSGTTVTLGTAVTGMNVGDYICISGKSPVAQIPRETQDLLAIGCAAEACRSRKDIASAQLLEQDYQRKAESVFTMLAPRVRRQNQKLISRYSPLRQNSHRYRYIYR